LRIFETGRIRKALYGELRRHLGEVFRKLAAQKESWIEEGHLMADHVHMMIAIGGHPIRKLERMELEKMREHVMALIEEHDIIVSWCKRPWRATGCKELWEIPIPPIKSAISYATALHEIGHILGRFQSSRSKMVREKWAWRWAEANALLWTTGMERDRLSCLEWYVSRKWPPILPAVITIAGG
jgi:hypothetical protein